MSKMDLYKKYLNGETESVYDEILNLGDAAFSANIFAEVEAVLDETFRRVRVNLSIIYEELQKTDYLFRWGPNCSRDYPLPGPLPNTDDLLKKLDDIVAPFGYVPLSLKKFYKYVGGCDFVWDYTINENRFWHGADPIEIVHLEELSEYVNSQDWGEQMSELDEFESPYLELAADYLHKDNISGGAPYSLEITKNPSIDGFFLFEPHRTTFIDYLRICFKGGGFSQISQVDIDQDYRSYFSQVISKMLPI
jgi:hypothetical protein